MKRVIIMGGGKLAYYLIESLKKKTIHIALIEQNEEHGERIVNHFDTVHVFTGDGTALRTMEDAGCRDADYYVAATGKDEDNLIGCQIAKRHFNVKTTVARVNNPRNIHLFKRLDVDLVYNSTQILSDLIEHNIQYDGMRVVFNVRETPQYIVEARLSDKSKARGRAIKDLVFPGNTRIVLISRVDKQSVIPTGDTVLQEGDMLLLVTEQKHYDAINDYLVK